MSTFIITGINSWMQRTTIMPFLNPPPPDHFYHILMQAFDNQSAIGWDQLLCGRLSKHWSTAHNIYICQHHISNQYHSKQIFLAIILAIYNFGSKIWCNCNNIVHGSIEDQAKHFTSTLDLQIEAAYEDPDLIQLEHDRNLLF